MKQVAEKLAHAWGGSPDAERWALATAVFGWAGAIALAAWLIASIAGAGGPAKAAWGIASAAAAIAFKMDVLRLLNRKGPGR